MNDEDARLYIEHRWPYGLADQAARNHVEGARPMTGFLATLTPEQRGAALAYRGADGAVGANDNGRVHSNGSDVSKRLDCLQRGKIIYLGSPYTLYPNGLHEAARHASRAAATLMARGFVVFAPISHGHAIACLSDDLPDSWDFWKAQCQPFIDAAAALVVLKLDGWKESVGLNYEIGEAERQGKPIIYVTPEELALREETIEAEWKRSVA